CDVAAVDVLFRRSRLAADIVARNVGQLAGSIGHDIAQQAAHRLAGFRLEELFAARVAVMLEEGGPDLAPAIDDSRGRGGKRKRRDGDAVTEADRRCLDLAPIAWIVRL